MTVRDVLETLLLLAVGGAALWLALAAAGAAG